ncbi:hypothetical protein B0T16DRAFT_6295 [Cercophora newfieldiana]|uniref:C2H2-type domain-containing protein n=1 Tax=Cercophora newfieldiana TaxID=92897 RepID=A0AA40CZQ7_9PEZI|nr:hypothetical protein B0T16DRAFT_6295 [Cercophora newfieldiana]
MSGPNNRIAAGNVKVEGGGWQEVHVSAAGHLPCGCYTGDPNAGDTSVPSDGATAWYCTSTGLWNLSDAGWRQPHLPQQQQQFPPPTTFYPEPEFHGLPMVYDAPPCPVDSGEPPQALPFPVPGRDPLPDWDQRSRSSPPCDDEANWLFRPCDAGSTLLPDFHRLRCSTPDVAPDPSPFPELSPELPPKLPPTKVTRKPSRKCQHLLDNGDRCGSTFKRTSELTRHVESAHRGSSGVFCPYCPTPLRRADTYNRHIRKKHPKFAKKKY